MKTIPTGGRRYVMTGGVGSWISEVMSPTLVTGASAARSRRVHQDKRPEQVLWWNAARKRSRAAICGEAWNDVTGGPAGSAAGMLTSHSAPAGEAFFSELREREFRRLALGNQAYLDYAGSALYADSHIRAHAALLATGLFGNPHSEHAASRASADATTAAKRRLLSFLDADSTANISVRCGCFCNPGAAETAFGLDRNSRTADCLRELDQDFSIERFRTCLGNDAVVGAIRASIGLANVADDIDRAVAMVATFRDWPAGAVTSSV